MIKVQVLSKCDYFDDKAYLPVGEQEDYHGRKYVRYKPCPYCESSGSTCKWVEWPEFLQLLEEDECPYEHVSHIGAYDNSPDGVWDDVEGICNAYGKIL